MAYRDNVTALAASADISNDPGLREEDLLISEIVFFPEGDEDPISILASDMNRGGRLFFQVNLPNLHNSQKIIITDELLAAAALYFAEIWEPNPLRTLIFALQNSAHLTIYLKD